MEPWVSLPATGPDPVFGVAEAYRNDSTHEAKLNLAIGAYVDTTGKAVCFDAVKTAFQKVVEAGPPVGYLTPKGDQEFCELSKHLVFKEGSNVDLDLSHIVSVQSLSGTGALTLAGYLCKELGFTTAYVSDPTWPIHKTAYKAMGYEIQTYRYWDSAKLGLDETGFRKDLEAAKPHSILIFHACAHNPTGQDLKKEDWEFVFDQCIQKGHMLILDMAYQGFASGNFVTDGFAVRRAYTRGIEDGLNFIVCQSYAKNMGLYGHRTGCCHAFVRDPKDAPLVSGNLGQIARRIWSNPPRMGSDVVKYVLTNKKLKEQWLEELRAVSAKLRKVREELRKGLEEGLSGSDWSHLTNQIGMFAYTGLSKEQCCRLRDEFGIYLLETGRISLAGLQTSQVPYLAKSIVSVILST